MKVTHTTPDGIVWSFKDLAVFWHAKIAWMPARNEPGSQKFTLPESWYETKYKGLAE